MGFCRVCVVAAAILLAGCKKYPPPPDYGTFDGLPVSGNLADARKAGFTYCIGDNVGMRCRRDDVTFQGYGPYKAAVDLGGSDGRGGFDHLTLWHDEDQTAVFKIGDVLEAKGWRSCLTGEDTRGDQKIFFRAGAPVRLSMDLSYWGKRRMRVIPSWSPREWRC
jgi:hypothetical protein